MATDSVSVIWNVALVTVARSRLYFYFFCIRQESIATECIYYFYLGLVSVLIQI